MPMLLLLVACGDVGVPLDPVAPTETDAGVRGGAEADEFFDAAVLHELVVTLDPDDWAVLREQARSYYDILGEGCMEGPIESPYTYFPATASLDGEAMGEVGVRKKGLIGSVVPDRPSLKIDVGEYVDEQRFFGLEKLVFNNGRQDASRMRTCLAHDWFGDAGLVAPRCALAHVVVNGEDLGIYAHTENIDEELVARRTGEFAEAMYEGTLSDFREGWTATFEYETKASTGAEIEAVKDALSTGDDGLLAALDEVLDLDAFFTFWAAESIAGHWDGYNGNTNNFYAYNTASEPRLRFVASGPDAAFDNRKAFGNGWVGTLSALANRLFQHDEGRECFEAELSRQLDENWEGESRLAQLDAWAELVADHDDSSMREGIAATRVVLENREDDVRKGMARGADAGELRGDVCWQTVGTVRVDFTTTWDSYPRGDLWTGGEAEVEYVIEGVAYPSTQDGVSAGTADDGRALWLTISEIAPGVYVAPYVLFDEEQLTDGAELQVDGDEAEAALLYWDQAATDTWETVAYLANGVLHFDTASTAAGAELSGWLEVEVVGSGG